MKSLFFSHRKILSFFITLLSIVGYGVVVFGAQLADGTTPPSGGYAAGDSILNPGCAPGSANCYQNTGDGVGWALTGDAGTDGGTTNFIGTTDAVDFVVKTNGAEIGRFGQNGNIAFGNYTDGVLVGPDTNGNIAVTASGQGAMAWGGSTGNYDYPFASGQLSTAWGVGTKATGPYATAFGDRTSAIEENATAFGTSNTASGSDSTAFGQGTLASNSASTAFGYDTIASGYASTAFGQSSFARSAYETSIGAYGTDYTPTPLGLGQFLSPTDRVFSIGNGDNDSGNNSLLGVWPDKNDAFTILKNGNSAFGINNWEGDSDATSIRLKLNGRFRGIASTEVASSTNRTFNTFEGTLTATGNTTNTAYSTLSGSTVWDGGAFNVSTASGTGGIAGITASVASSPTSSGTISNMNGINSTALHQGSGNIDNLYGLNNLAGNLGTGTVNAMKGINGSVTNLSATGVVNTAYGINSVVSSNVSGATINNAFGIDARVTVQSGGIVNNADVMHLTSFIRNTGSIFSTNGINFSSGMQGSVYQPGIEAINLIKGINFSSTFDGVTDVPSLTAADVYGIYFSNASLQGTSGMEYALFIDDAEAQNFFRTGLRIGVDSDSNKISDVTSGSGSSTLYIGTNTIDTTAPSDQRTKQNIIDTSYGLDVLKNIRVVDFMYDQSIINDNNKQHTGVLAQQVEPLYPEAVGHRTDGYMMVDYKTFIPLLIKSVQELNLKVASMDTLTTPSSTFLSSISGWLGNASNGIARIFTHEICLSEEGYADECITRAQLQQLKQLLPQQNNYNSGGQTQQPVPQEEPVVSETPTEPQPETVTEEPLVETPPTLEPTPEPTVEPTPEPAPEPASEPAPEPTPEIAPAS